MNYSKQIQKVIEYISDNFDDNKFDLDTLSRIACFSKYHFHRIFTATIGMSLQQYIRWLRLKRAAHQLIVQNDKPIIEIAIDAGFESHEAFSRAFKQVSGENPKRFRQLKNFSMWEKTPYALPNVGEIKMKIEIKEKKARRLAVIEHRGDPALVADSVDRLISWTKSQHLDLKPKAGEAFGFGYDDPKMTKPEEFRFDLGITIPESLKLEGDVVEKQLPQGRYAVTLHHGSRETIDQTVYNLYRDWLPTSSEELADFPCIFCYQNFDHEVAETELLTEIWVLLK
ncbi:AraC family transcriptional regulator [Thiotrichales bacterium 19S3-7]|nr:AraC family transcriptional regulator [Thiotrichales bacterium 19S3-7]MCF6800895.1 AraC family transcriptional regulator [Thiotrichales bacterium 19S3-11]